MTKLVAEIANDPLGIGYQDVNASGDLLMSDVDVTGSLNSPTRTKNIPITSAELLAWAGGGAIDASGVNSRYERIEDAANGHVSPAIRGACKAAIKLIERDGTQLDLSIPDRQIMIGGMVAGSVLTAEEHVQLIVLGTESISRASELGLYKVKPGHVETARLLVANNPIPSGA